jgi:hypothetical protein
LIVTIVYELDSNQISQIVKDLKNHGYIVGVDFDFEYSAGRFDWQTSTSIPKQTKFTFYNETLGTFFYLKYI